MARNAALTGSSQAAAGKSPLDDVMIAMDVVDTLRHDRNLVERELNDDARRADLIDRLREIYRSQGIEVSDALLAEGVRALEEDRFSYTPPNPEALATKLARLYVTRWQWGKWVAGILIGVLVAWSLNYLAFERPRELQQAAEMRERASLPATLTALAADIRAQARDPLVATRAEETAQAGSNAARTGDLREAQKLRDELQRTLRTLRESYQIRIVNRPGVVSGLWRIPDANPDGYNFYLVVEAVGSNGKVLSQEILNEETGTRERVKAWAQRVDRQVLVDVKADKEDDGIIQNNIAGRKERGRLEPDWSIPVRGGAITKW